MILTLAREAKQIEVGNFHELVFTKDEIQAPDGRVVAAHQHNRWREGQGGEPFVRLDLVGPLTIHCSDGEASRLGPYEHFSCVDGVAYVERRVFGFWDLQQRDWYLVDLGAHCKSLRLRRAGA